jgi:hypothetical protein
MAQLTDDCFAFAGPLLPVEDMERMIAERIRPLGETETVTLHAAHGRVLAHDVVAPLDLPPFDNSAVDGYAVRHADLGANAETQLKIVGRLQAGAAAKRSVGEGEAIRIFTGASQARRQHAQGGRGCPQRHSCAAGRPAAERPGCGARGCGRLDESFRAATRAGRAVFDR